MSTKKKTPQIRPGLRLSYKFVNLVPLVRPITIPISSCFSWRPIKKTDYKYAQTHFGSLQREMSVNTDPTWIDRFPLKYIQSVRAQKFIWRAAKRVKRGYI